MGPAPTNPGDLVGACLGEPEVWGVYAACLKHEQLERLAKHLTAMRNWADEVQQLCGAVTE